MENQKTKAEMNMKKSISDFLGKSSRPELFKKVWRASGLNFKDVKKYPEDYRDPSSGSVPGMIYYYDTEKFAKNNISEILELIAEYDEATGGSLLREAEKTNFLNFLTWFTYESMMIELTDYLED